MTEETVDETCPEALDGQRIDRVVAMIADVSRKRAGDLIAGGQVTVDGQPAEKPSVKVTAGARIRFVHERPTEGIEADPSVVLTILHLDDDVIVVDKPAGLVVHPGAGVHTATLANGLVAQFPEIVSVGEPARPGIVHRLDKGTSGVLMVARTAVAHAGLSAQLAARTVERVYRTVVHGHVESERGVVDAPLGRSPRDPSVRAVVAGGRPARTHYTVVRRGLLVSVVEPSAEESVPASAPSSRQLQVTELECRLETGRTHQIRAHLTAIDHPVLADTQYGGRAPNLGSRGRLARPFLHAETLGFVHPVSGEHLSFTSPLPSDLVTVLEQCEPVADDDGAGDGS